MLRTFTTGYIIALFAWYVHRGFFRPTTRRVAEMRYLPVKDACSAWLLHSSNLTLVQRCHLGGAAPTCPILDNSQQLVRP